MLQEHPLRVQTMEINANRRDCVTIKIVLHMLKMRREVSRQSRLSAARLEHDRLLLRLSPLRAGTKSLLQEATPHKSRWHVTRIHFPDLTFLGTIGTLLLSHSRRNSIFLTSKLCSTNAEPRKSSTTERTSPMLGTQTLGCVLCWQS